MNFTALKAELAARGFNMLTAEGRDGDFINRAVQELDTLELWPYLENSATGVAPLAIADLGTVEMVINTSRLDVEIPYAGYGELVQWFGDLSVTGTPEFWYRATPAGVPTVATYPVSTDVIGVQYYKTTADLVAGADEPEAPARWHRICVDIAVRDAYRDSDNHQFAEALQAQIDRDLSRMRQALFNDQVQSPSFVRIVHGSDDS